MPVADRLAAQSLIVDVDGFEGQTGCSADSVADGEDRSAQNIGTGNGASVFDLC